MARWSSAPIFKFGSHLPVLIKALSLADGPALEMGMGMSSSIVMHWLCAAKKQLLVSYENDRDFFKWPLEANRFDWELHKVIYIEDWDKADIEKPWGVAFIDHVPSARRKVDIKRLANYAQYIVIHDAEGRHNSVFHYEEVYPLFKWKYDYNDYFPKTSVLSNFVDLTNFTV
ncbi:MAG: hypothetical protein Q7S31_00075 [bacterium]|nr:hypothetical protein [bacterium]